MNEKGPSRIRRRKRVRGKIEEQREKGKRESEGESVVQTISFGLRPNH